MKNHLLIGITALLLSPFGRLLSQPANNNFASATDVSALINTACTTSGAFTTQLATPDQSKPACWSNGPNNNVWFKFTATATTFINVKIKVSGAGETIQNPFVAIVDAGGVSLACQNYQGAKTDLSLSYLGLVAGNTYYIDVDNYSGYSGSFDLCLSDAVDYDFKQGAKDVTAQINSTCTTGGSYTTQFATPDQSKGTCWSNGPNNNVWFKFTATATTFINAKVRVSGAGETMQNPFVAIFDAGGAQLTCQNYQGAKTDLSLSYLGLVAGNTYYIAVDNYSGYAGSFDLCLSDVVDYDFKQGAKDVTAQINSTCTTGGSYTTQFATPDQSKGTCWSNGPNNNVWFKFTATATTFINAKVKVSGAGETMQNPFVAIFDAGGAQLTCQNYQGAKTDLSLSYYGLVPGNTYYIAVDSYSGYAGSFDLCLSDVVDYDFKQGAKDVTAQINSTCTTGGSYTTQFATPDQLKGTCWSNGPNNNVWFKFTATATTFINAKVKVSGAGETMQNPFVAIFDAGGAQLACQNYQGAKTDLSLSYFGLVPGNTYYIAVDNYSGYAGSFDLCLSDVVDYDYKQGAKDVTAQLNSATSGGTYSTQYGSPDQSKGTCWSNGPNNNVWFSFTASSTGYIIASAIVSAAGETMQNPFIVLYDASGTQLACQNYQGAKTNISVTYSALIPGNTYYIAVDNYAGYKGSFDLGVYDNLIVLPLDGLVLKAAVYKSQVDLKWTTNSESNTASFVVERAKDGVVFDSIGRVLKAGTLGSSYVFTDKNPYLGNSFYRLRAADLDGHFSYSTTVAVSTALSIKAVFTLFPNPNNAKSVTWLKIDGVIDNSSVSVALYSMQGQRVFSKVVAIDGSHGYLMPIDTGIQLAPGIYDVVVIGAGTGTLLYQQKLMIR
jgi:hypothetical protein